MSFENLRTTIAKLRYGELMVATAGAMLIAVSNALLDPETLKFLDSSGLAIGFTYRLVIWGVVIILAALLLSKGLWKIDHERNAEDETSICPPDANLPIISTQNGSLKIQISHGSTNISIHIQPEKNIAQ